MGQQALAAVIHEIGPGFAARAADSDRRGEFVAENYRTLKQHKLFAAAVPRELGGGGASFAELCEMLRSLAQYCPSTALAFSMHTHNVAAAVWRHLHGQPAAQLLEAVAKAQLVIATSGANDWLASNGRAVRVDGGWRVTAKKRFVSGSPGADLVTTSAAADVPGEGPMVLHFALKLDSPGVRIGDDWDTLGMRATGSHTLSLDEVFVPDAAVTMKRVAGKWFPPFNVVATVACPIITSVYVGLAEHAASLAKESARGRAGALAAAPHLPYLLGELENELTVAQLALAEAIGNVRNYDFLPELERANRALVCKTLVARAVRRCLDLAVEASGGGAFFRTSAIERLWRDVQAVQFHPLPEKQQLLLSGRVAMGLPPIAE